MYEMWNFKKSKELMEKDRLILLFLTITGLLSVVSFLNWWFRSVHVNNLLFFTVFSVVFWYGIIRICIIWINYTKIKKPLSVPKPAQNLSVAVFTTSAPGEPISMFEKTFQALNNLNYPHQAYLLDSTQDPAFKKLAEKYNITFLSLANLPGAKAGKINEALKLTDEDFILILDPDHIVYPNFLDQTLGFFEDDKVGFVQVSQGYYNQYRSFVANGAAEQTYHFYGPYQMGFLGLGSAVAIGANCVFRRKALESIGGHAVSLAEDFLTSLKIHAKGWKSIYNPVIVSRGIVPEDLNSFCNQQLKWSRGAFEVLFSEFPKYFSKLSFGQKLVYFSIGTYYLTGVCTLFFMLVPFFYFFFGALPLNMNLSDFFTRGILIVLVSILIYFYVQRFLCDYKNEKGFHFKGMMLKFVCWPVYTYGFLLAIFKKKIPYIPTQKTINKSVSIYVLPLAIYIVVFILGLSALVVKRTYWTSEGQLIENSPLTWHIVAFAFFVAVQSLLGILIAFKSRHLNEEYAWEKINVSLIKNTDIL